MRRIRKFFLVPGAERGLLVRATVQLGAISLGLQLLPSQTVRRLTAPGTRPSDAQQHADSFSPVQIGWAVSVAGRYVPGGGTSLPQALATHVLLEQEGYAARLRIGVAKDAATEADTSSAVTGRS